MQPAAVQPLPGHVEEHLRWQEELDAVPGHGEVHQPPVAATDTMAEYETLGQAVSQQEVQGGQRKKKAEVLRVPCQGLDGPCQCPQAGHTPLRNHPGGHGQGKGRALVFYPYPEGTTEASLHGGPAGFVEESSHGDPKGKGKGKGKSKLAWQYIHYNLLSVGLEVPNARPPRPLSPPRAAGHDQWSHWPHWGSSSSRGSSSKGTGGGGRGGGHGWHPYQAWGHWHEQL